jgi:N-acetylglucosamine kinase-like BadF-type ATPase
MTDNMSASDLAIVIAQSCESNFGGDQTMTVVDLSKMEELKTAVDDLVNAINSAGSAARSAAKKYYE